MTWRNSIKTRILVNIILVHAVMMGLLVWELVTREGQLLRDMTQQQAQDLAQGLAASSSNALLAADLAGLNELLLTVRDHQGLDHLIILRNDGRILAHNNPRYIGQYLSDDSSLRLLKNETTTTVLISRDDYLDLAAPVYSLPRTTPVGWVRLGLRLDHLQAQQQAILSRGLTYALIAIVLGGLIALMLAFRVTRALDLLRLTTQAFQHGQRDLQAPTLEHTELQQLAQDMNQLFARISEQEQQLNLYKQALDAIPHGVIISDITRAPQPIIYVNQAFTDLTGYYPEQVLGRNCNFLQGQDTDPQTIQKIHAAVQRRTGFDGVILNYKQSGEPFWNSLRISPIVNADGSISHMVGTETDVTALHNAMDQLQQLAMTDGLTGLSNRRAFHDLINQHLNTPEAKEQGCAMVMLDLDGFKPVNDTLGHDAGDELLRQVAQRIRTHLHPHDLSARLGGDEFALLLTGCRSSTRALQRLDTLAQHLNQPYLLAGEKVENISASIGLAMFPDHGDNADELLRHADQAMYDAKRAGRNRSQIYAPPPR